jgi:hypothetical protein
MSLSNGPSTEPSCESKTAEHQQNTLPSVVAGQSEASAEAKTFAAQAMERIRQQVSATLSDEEELEIGSDFQLRDKTQCTTQQLETIRRERNRMHAKKTRLRKKKMLTEMETVSCFVLWLVYLFLPLYSWRSVCSIVKNVALTHRLLCFASFITDYLLLRVRHTRAKAKAQPAACQRVGGTPHH